MSLFTLSHLATFQVLGVAAWGDHDLAALALFGEAAARPLVPDNLGAGVEVPLAGVTEKFVLGRIPGEPASIQCSYGAQLTRCICARCPASTSA
jgi:hypothetical protein